MHSRTRTAIRADPCLPRSGPFRCIRVNANRNAIAQSGRVALGDGRMPPLPIREKSRHGSGAFSEKCECGCECEQPKTLTHSHSHFLKGHHHALWNVCGGDGGARLRRFRIGSKCRFIGSAGSRPNGHHRALGRLLELRQRHCIAGSRLSTRLRHAIGRRLLAVELPERHALQQRGGLVPRRPGLRLRAEPVVLRSVRPAASCRTAAAPAADVASAGRRSSAAAPPARGRRAFTTSTRTIEN